MEIKSISISRKDLYEQVWATPMSRLAARYGMSDVGLAKICKKNKIPRPPRGYWAMRQFGNAPRRTPLPNKENNPIIVINPYSFRAYQTDLKNPIQKLIPQERQPDKKIIVPEKLVNPHPLIINTAEILNSLAPDRTGKIKSPWGRCLDIEVTPRDLPRALLIMDTLIKAIEERGYEIPPIEGQTIVKIFDAYIGFGLRGQAVRTPVEPGEHDLDGYYQFGYNLTSLRPELPGNLQLAIISGYRHNLTRVRWGDTPIRRLEDLLNEFMIGLLKAAASVMEFSTRTINQKEDENESHQPDRETGDDL
jgi:hypothetical protein